MGQYLPSLGTPRREPGEAKKVFVRHVAIWVNEVGLNNIFVLWGSAWTICPKILPGWYLSTYCPGVHLGEIFQAPARSWVMQIHLNDIPKLSSFTFHLLLQTQVERASEDESNPCKESAQVRCLTETNWVGEPGHWPELRMSYTYRQRLPAWSLDSSGTWAIGTKKKLGPEKNGTKKMGPTKIGTRKNWDQQKIGTKKNWDQQEIGTSGHLTWSQTRASCSFPNLLSQLAGQPGCSLHWKWSPLI